MLEDGQVAFGMVSQADLFIERGIEQAYNKPSRIDFREAQWEVLLPPATAWLSIAGNTIHSICLADESGQTERSGMKVDKLGGRRKVWSRQLWGHWKAQLQELAIDCDVDGECQDLAAQAVKKMTKVEAKYED